MTRRFITSALVAVLVLSCSPGIEPMTDQPSADLSEPHFLQWSPADGPLRLTAIGAIAERDPVRAGDGPTELVFNEISLSSYAARFWAVRGKERTLQLNYLSPMGTSPFLRLEIDDPAIRPDGSSIAYGDSVLITVLVDPVNIRVSLEPTGLQFGHEADLEMWWTGTNGDLNGDGVVDTRDLEIEKQWLGLWYQEGAGTPWTPIPAEKSLSDKRLEADLKHFSGYAVSW